MKTHTKIKILLFNLTILFFVNTSNLQGQNFHQDDDYTLDLDRALNDSGSLFTLIFSNNTNQIEPFKNAEVSVIIEDNYGNSYSQYLYKIDITEQEQVLDDNYIQFDGKDYLIYNNNSLIKFLPSGLIPDVYSFKVVLHHKKIGTIYSNSINLNLPLILNEDNRKIIYLRGSIDAKVYGEIELIVDKNNSVEGRFTNIDTKKIIYLKGKYIPGSFGTGVLNLEEYENYKKLTGYFEGNLVDGIYKGYWISPKRSIRAPFVFTNR